MPFSTKMSLAFFSFVLTIASKRKGSYEVGVDFRFSRCSLKISFTLFLFIVRNGAKSSVQPVVTVRLNQPPITDPKTKVMRQDVGGRQIGSDQVQQRGVKSLRHTFKELAAKLSRGLPAFTVRLSEVTSNETFLTVSMEGNKRWSELAHQSQVRDRNSTESSTLSIV
jgi:hypothetical protein